MVKQDGYTVVDLFCGAGGMSEGFKMSGYKILLGIEADHHAAETYIKNNPDSELIVNDIRTGSSNDIKTKLKGRTFSITKNLGLSILTTLTNSRYSSFLGSSERLRVLAILNP